MRGDIRTAPRMDLIGVEMAVKRGPLWGGGGGFPNVVCRF